VTSVVSRMSTFRLLAVLVACMLSQGCVGILVGSRDTTTTENPSLSKTADVDGVLGVSDGVKYNGPWLRSHWGTPSTVKSEVEGAEVWTYGFGQQCWCGVMPALVIPIPLMIPTGTEKVVFLLRDDQVVSATQVKWRRSGGGVGLGPDGWGHW